MTGSTKRTLAATATAAVFIAIILAVLVDARREPTFDARLKWHAPPVVLKPPSDPVLATYLAYAVDNIHRSLGKKCPVFVVDSEKEPDVLVTGVGVEPCGKPEDAPKTAHASLYPCSHIVIRQTAETVEETVAVLDVTHELGHVLQLAHDDVPGSIMNSPPEYGSLAAGRPLPSLTPKDIAAIKARVGCP